MESFVKHLCQDRVYPSITKRFQDIFYTQYYDVGPVNEHQMKQQTISGMSKPQHSYSLSAQVTSEAFSEKMTSEQLAVWLSHHTYMVGTDYLVDVEKLKGNSK